jgi:hypothetical protein
MSSPWHDIHPEQKGIASDPHGPSRSVLLCLGCGRLPPHTGSEAICPACIPPNGSCDCPGCALVQAHGDALAVEVAEAALAFRPHVRTIASPGGILTGDRLESALRRYAADTGRDLRAPLPDGRDATRATTNSSTEENGR